MKYLVVENCNECPFLSFIDVFGDNKTKDISNNKFCKKLRLSGSEDELFKHCPLPNNCGQNTTITYGTIVNPPKKKTIIH